VVAPRGGTDRPPRCLRAARSASVRGRREAGTGKPGDRPNEFSRGFDRGRGGRPRSEHAPGDGLRNAARRGARRRTRRAALSAGAGPARTSRGGRLGSQRRGARAGRRERLAPDAGRRDRAWVGGLRRGGRRHWIWPGGEDQRERCAGSTQRARERVRLDQRGVHRPKRQQPRVRAAQVGRRRQPPRLDRLRGLVRCGCSGGGLPGDLALVEAEIVRRHGASGDWRARRRPRGRRAMGYGAPAER
jgi:hypothetical protein